MMGKEYAEKHLNLFMGEQNIFCMKKKKTLRRLKLINFVL